MADGMAGGQQDVFLCARENLRVTGVKNVVAFDESCILLETVLGRLHVKGKDLKVKSLNEQAEELVLEGKIDSLAYAGGGKQGGSVFRRLFQ
ncbi:MAG: YabP/YqfC family sporulation protein [Lachnospiraceae bacterium]|nr:YabP/YqfC family sporulation protein [Lachnospiraceae bacterium]